MVLVGLILKKSILTAKMFALPCTERLGLPFELGVKKKSLAVNFVLMSKLSS